MSLLFVWDIEPDKDKMMLPQLKTVWHIHDELDEPSSS